MTGSTGAITITLSIPRGSTYSTSHGYLLGGQVLAEKMTGAKRYLDDTQHKFGSDYELKEGEDLTPIILKRSEFRAFIRANEGEIPDEIEVDEILDEPVA